MRQLLTRTTAAAALCLCSGLTAFSDPVQMGPDQLRQAAAVALRHGDTLTAQNFAQALIARDATDMTAHLIKARALRDRGQIAPARAAARTAWQLAETDAEKYSAALITAQVLSSDGKRTLAQLWLRGAVQHAPDDRLKAKAKRDFAYVKRRNPWSTQLSFTFAPNSNINNGSARDRSQLNYLFSESFFGEAVEYSLSGSAQALSGLEIGGAAKSRYRFNETGKTAHDLNFGLSYRTFALSGSAKEQAPSLSGSDFAFGTASLGYGYKQINYERRGEFALDLETGQSWYGGARYATYLRGAMQQSLSPTADQRYRFGVNAERQWGQATPDMDSFGASASMTRRYDNGHLGYVGLRITTTQSASVQSEYDEVELRTGFVLGTPVMGAAVQLGVGASLRDYDASPHSRDGRQDRRIFADVTATFEQIDYYGFNPSVTLSAAHTDSNIGIFDTQRLGISLGIKSAF